MTAYLVCLKAEHEHHSREIVGFFVTETMRDLLSTAEQKLASVAE